MSGCEQGRLVDDVGQVGTGKIGSLLGDLAQVRVRGERFASNVKLQNGIASFEIWGIQDHLTVEAPRAQQCAIQNVGPVGGREDNDTDIGFKTVQANQQLIECLLC